MEKEVERYLVSGIRKRGGLCLKWVSPGYTGVPDRILLLPHGRVVLVELKQHGGRLSGRQRLFRKKAEQLGQDYRCLWDKDNVDEFLREVDAWSSGHTTTSG